MLKCANCHRTRIDPETGICDACGMQSAVSGVPLDKEAVLAGYYRNMLIRLAELSPGGFQQSLGIFGPLTQTPGDHGVPFSTMTLDAAYDYLTKHDVMCAKIVLRTKTQAALSIVFANDKDGIEDALRQARKAARKFRATIEITGTPN